MSLYYETAAILENPDKIGGSFKARIFKKKDLKSKPGQIYALVAEASKWSRVLKDVIEKCAVLGAERKVSTQRPQFFLDTITRYMRLVLHGLRTTPFASHHLAAPLTVAPATADTRPRAAADARPPAQQIRRRRTQRPCPAPRHRAPQGAARCRTDKVPYPPQVPHAGCLPRRRQRGGPRCRRRG